MFSERAQEESANLGNYTTMKLKNLTPLFRTLERSWITSSAMRHTNTHRHHQDTDAESCSVKTRPGGDPGIERTATFRRGLEGKLKRSSATKHVIHGVCRSAKA